MFLFVKFSKNSWQRGSASIITAGFPKVDFSEFISVKSSSTETGTLKLIGKRRNYGKFHTIINHVPIRKIQ